MEEDKEKSSEHRGSELAQMTERIRSVGENPLTGKKGKDNSDEYRVAI